MSGKYCIGALELLVISGGSKRLDELWREMLIKFQSDPQFLSIICFNISAFEQFIRKQTALFKVHDGVVYMVDICDSLSAQHQTNVFEERHRWSHRSSNGYGQIKVLPKPDNSSGFISGNVHELEVLEYFQKHLLQIPERLIPVKLLVDHFSQSPPSIRAFIGHESNIITFLSLHPSHFHIQGDLIGLTSLRGRVESGSKQRRLSQPISIKVNGDRDFPSSDSQSAIEVKISDMKTHSVDTSTIVLTLNECKALLWIMQQVTTDSFSVKELLSAILIAPKAIQSCVGWTHIDLVEFLKKHPQFIKLSVSEEHINLCDISAVSLIAVLDQTESSDSHILMGHRGSIFRVEKLWGIIDLGFHEHVFFDKSLFKNVTDLTKHFKIKETVYFNAQRAPKESRAKWRATCVWKETDHFPDELSSNSGCTKEASLDITEDSDSGLENSNKSEMARITECRQVQRKHFSDIASAYDTFIDKFAALRVAAPWEVQAAMLESSYQTQSEAEKSVDWCNLQKNDDPISREQVRSSSSSSVSDMNTLSDIPSISAGIPDCHPQHTVKLADSPDVFYPVCSQCDDCDIGFNIDDPSSEGNDQAPKSVFTQTLFTGEIMATKLYHDTTAEPTVN